MYRYIILTHILAATIWTGGHIVLATCILPPALQEKSPDLIESFESRFERLGVPALVVQVITGLWLAHNLLPFRKLGTSPLSIDTSRPEPDPLSIRDHNGMIDSLDSHRWEERELMQWAIPFNNFARKSGGNSSRKLKMSVIVLSERKDRASFPLSSIIMFLDFPIKKKLRNHIITFSCITRTRGITERAGRVGGIF